ncbi:hypothetical protein SDC9_161358 [bioreactor metagenome]|uniref:Uncharacterized protein n=1 Tax=bioreactor metagenome TaxID=1076179 RepID=A0A645FKE4_9ZZZZ
MENINPYSPRSAAKIRFSILVKTIGPSIDGTKKLEVPVIAVIIIIGALINLAETAASPRTRAPTILTVCPIFEGSLLLASIISSNTKSISISSTILGKGTESLEANILTKSGVGNNS